MILRLPHPSLEAVAGAVLVLFIAATTLGLLWVIYATPLPVAPADTTVSCPTSGPC